MPCDRCCRRLVGCIALVIAVLLPATARAQESGRVETLVGLARVQRDRGHLAGAAESFREADRLRPFSGALLVEYFWAAANGHAVEAEMLGLRVLSADPTQDAVRDRLIGLLAEKADEKSIERLARDRLGARPPNPLWLRRLAESLLRQHRYVEAAQSFGEAGTLPGGGPADLAQAATALEAAGAPPDARARAWDLVPPAVWVSRQEWHGSRLRAVVPTMEPGAAALALADYLARYPSDRSMRALCIETWVRAGRPDRALALIGPLRQGGDRHQWLRREAEIALLAGDAGRATRSLDELVNAGHATHADRLRLANLLVDRDDREAAALLLREDTRSAAPCAEDALQLLSRIGDARALIDAVRARRPTCVHHAEWIDRAVDLAMASGLHREALALLESIDASVDPTPARRLRLGQLLLWTGRPMDATAVLEPLAAAAPASAAALNTLVDAYRSQGRAANAWAVAERLLAAGSLPDPRRLDLAEVAIEAEAPERAFEIADAISRTATGDEPASGALHTRAGVIAGRALAAAANPAAALWRLQPVVNADAPPAAIVALLEATVAMRGAAAALDLAGRWGLSRRDDADLLARLALWSLVDGDRTMSARLAARVGELSVERARLLSAELALAGRHPAEAATVLAPILAVTPGHPAALDLAASAAAAEGHLDEARALSARLLVRTPNAVRIAVREAGWLAEAMPGEETMARLVALQSDHPSRLDARLALARAHLRAGRVAEALSVLGDGVAQWQALPEDGVRLAVGALRQRRAPADALAVLRGSMAESLDLRLTAAELTAAVEGPATATAAFERLVADDRCTPFVFTAWARATQDPAQRLAIVRRGHSRFPDTIDLAEDLAIAAWVAGRNDEALAAARAAIDAEPDRVGPWFVAAKALSASGDRPGLLALLDRFGARFMSKPDVVADLVSLASGLVLGPADPIAARALDWTAHLLAADPSLDNVVAARARVLAAIERWDDAVALLDLGLARTPRHPALLRLRADVLSYRGHFGPALAAYDAYLAVAPDDVEARRQQARVAGWGQRYDRSLALYDALRERASGMAAITAEREAKAAYYSGAWHDAVPAYERWLAIEPDDREARFELAQCLDRIGDLVRADREFGTLASKLPLHRQALEAREQLAARSAVRVGPVGEAESSNGYGGQRLLERSRAGWRVERLPGLDTEWGLGFESSRRGASAPHVQETGYDAALSASRRVNPDVQLRGTVGAERNAWSRPALLVGQLGIDWRPGDVWRVEAGLARRSFLENATTLRDGMALTGVEFGLLAAKPAWSVALRGTADEVSGDNRRSDVRIEGRLRL